MNRALISILLVLLIAASGGYIYYFLISPDGSAVPLSTTPPTDKAAGDKAAPALPGLMAGPIVSHTTYETEHTRIRAVLALRHIADSIRSLIPDELMNNRNVPPGIRKALEDDFENVLPYEVAILGGANHEAGRYQMLLFANQRYLARLVPIVPQLRGLPVVLPILDWDTPETPLTSAEDTVLTSGASVPIPEAVATAISEAWAAREEIARPAPITGEALLEVTIDNTEGDLMAMAFSLVEANGVSYERFASMQQFQIASGIIRDIATARLTANLDDTGALAIDVHIQAVENPSAALVSMVPTMTSGFGLGMLNSQLAEYDVTVEGGIAYEQEARALVGAFQVKGFKAAIESALAAFMGGEGAPVELPADSPEAGGYAE